MRELAVLDTRPTAWLAGGKPTELCSAEAVSARPSADVSGAKPGMGALVPFAVVAAGVVAVAAGVVMRVSQSLQLEHEPQVPSFTEQPCISTAASAVRDGALDSTVQLSVLARLLLPSSSSLKRLSNLDAAAVPTGALASPSIAIATQAAANALAVAYAQLHPLPSSVR